MPAQPDYTTLDLYTVSKRLVLACYELTQDLPAEEKTNLVPIIRNAGVTVYLNVAQGTCLEKRKKKRKLIQSAQNALVVIDAAVEVLIELQFTSAAKASELVNLSSTCSRALIAMKKEK